MDKRWIATLLVLLAACAGAPALSMTTTDSVTPLPPFNEATFATAVLEAALAEEGGEIALVVLVPESQQTAMEATVFDQLPELAGYTWIDPALVEREAARIAAEEGTAPPTRPLIAYGLIPLFADTDIDGWARSLSELPGASIATRTPSPSATEIPLGWNVLAQVDATLTGGAVVGFLRDAVVVAQWDSTLVINRQGDVDDVGEPPLTVTHGCCGGAQGVEAGNSFVIGHELTREAWVFDLDSGRWRQVDPRPTTGFVLGTAYLDDELIVVNAAPRPVGPVTSESLSTVASLDLSSGTWRDLGVLPEPIMVGGVGDDGSRAFIAGTAQGPNNNILGGAQPLVFEYRPGDGSEALPPIPIHGQASTVVWVEEAGLLGWNYDLESAILDDSGEWRSAGAVPMDPAECYPRSESVTGGAVAFCGGIAFFEGATETWHPVPIFYGVASWFGTTTNSVIGLVQIARDKAVLIEYPLPGAG